ncbi:MAG: MBOAT family protein, partial [Planctomycetales bacterium]|nr:MBOAT family protein [Planctomycetales bacterium]
AVDYAVGRLLNDEDRLARRKGLLWLSVVMNLGLLGVFKYFNFFVESAGSLLSWMGLPASDTTLAIVLPVGISFYTFQTMSYTIDVYRRDLKAEKSALNFALFVAFFPQLVAGPVVRARDFLPQLASMRRFRNVDVQACLVLFLVGFFKKACVSDNIAPVVDAYFSDPYLYRASAAWLGVLLYAVQIYCDFSGYSDMAIACAGLLGYNLCVNFNHPYFATDITSFWRRWHISLSSWLRDYLYISLGGNRGSTWFLYRNLMLTMLLGGLWHGAAWRFVIWGGLHGLALIAHRLWRTCFPEPLLPARLGPVVGAAATFYWVCLAWIFFRAETLGSAWAVTQAYVFGVNHGTKHLPSVWFAILPLLLAMHWISYRGWATPVLERAPRWSLPLGYGLLFPLLLALMHTHAAPFIYFQF